MSDLPFIGISVTKSGIQIWISASFSIMIARSNFDQVHRLIVTLCVINPLSSLFCSIYELVYQRLGSY